jgi:hypothetical protein
VRCLEDIKGDDNEKKSDILGCSIAVVFHQKGEAAHEEVLGCTLGQADEMNDVLSGVKEMNERFAALTIV